LAGLIFNGLLGRLILDGLGCGVLQGLHSKLELQAFQLVVVLLIE
jgi:hypothetical protein